MRLHQMSTSALSHQRRATSHSFRLALQEERLSLQNREGFFESCNFCLTLRLLLFVCLSFRYATVLKCFQILQHWIQFCLNASPVGCCLSNCCIKLVWLLGVLVNFVFFRLLHICCCSHFLSCNHFCELLFQVGLCNFQQADDTGAGTLCGIV